MSPLVSIIMGSDSDLAIMQGAAGILDDFGISYELTIISAHRTPERLFTYGKGAAERGIRVIIAGAGGAAHLPGMIAALSPIPVIGVPLVATQVMGVDSLFSIAQMPFGTPVNTMAINGAKNAGLAAVQMLSIKYEALQSAIQDFKQKLQEEVIQKAQRLEQDGWKKYLENM